MKEVIIHSDGGCEGNPGPGGWAAVLEHGKHRKEISGGDPATTNNRMELLAAIHALEALKQPCAVVFHTDSEYVRNGITKWVTGWKRRGWVKADKTPVKNADLWQRLDAASKMHRIDWRWVRGHTGNPGNERCDTLAQSAIEKIKHQYTPAQRRELLGQFLSTRTDNGDPDELFGTATDGRRASDGSDGGG